MAAIPADNSNVPVRVRLAPSPTGLFHVGTGRNALSNWLFARQHHGQFLLRIEDTDIERNREEWVDGIVDMMRWLDLSWDEQLYRSTEFLDRHADAAKRLFADGRAYYCDCTQADVTARHAERGRKTPGYDGHCRDRGLAPGEGRALRFRTPDEGTIEFHDVVRGDVAFDNATIDDFIIVRSNGAAIFILANIVEDSEMGITHILRSEEHISNVPKAIMVWNALELGDLPVFAHLPLLVNEKRQKISKRRPEDKAAMEEYRDEGYLPEAMCNYLALLGWGPRDDQELMDRDELLVKYRLEDVNSSAAFFDQKKLRHFNQQYIARLSGHEFVEHAVAMLDRAALAYDAAVVEAMAGAVQERTHVLSDVVPMLDFFFVDTVTIDDTVWTKAIKGVPAPEILAGAVDALGACEWTRDAIEAAAVAEAERLELAVRKWQAPVRVALTGRPVGPPLWESIELLGRERTLARLREAQARTG